MKVLLHKKIQVFTFFSIPIVYFHPTQQDIMLAHNVFFKRPRWTSVANVANHGYIIIILFFFFL